MKGTTGWATTQSGLLSVALAAAAVLLVSTRDADAYIERLYSLREVLDESTNILLGKIDRVDKSRRVAEAIIESSLKGEIEYRRIQMNLSAGINSQADYLLETWVEGDPFLLYYSRQGGRIASLGHAGDTWFQLYANHRSQRDRVWWRFTHIEIYMGRTFDGTTPELIEVTSDAQLRGRKPPPPDPRVPTLDVRALRRARARRSTRARGDLRTETLIPRQAAWRYLKGTQEASEDRPRHSAWRASDFDDSSWEVGRAPFGYGDRPFGTELSDMRKSGLRKGYSSLFLRRPFQVADPASVRRLSFEVDYDDGFVLWINGTRVVSVNAPDGSLAHDQAATAQHESGTYERFDVPSPARLLASGNNVLAAQVFNVNLTSSDLKMDLELEVDVRAAKSSGRFRRLLELSAAPGEVRGISWVDVNGDEQLDVYFCRGTRDVLLVSDGERFVDRTLELGIPAGSRAASWADYNGDDHPDLLLNDFRLFTNVGGRLEPSRLPPPPEGRNPEGAGWIDYNGDGLPDILITNGEHGICLYENTGRGPAWFRDASGEAALGERGLGKGNGDFVVFADYDGDGYTDFLYNLAGGVLAHNEGDGTFRVEEQSGIELPRTSSKRGVTFADFDNDGDLDLFVPGPEAARLYRNNNDGTFTDVIRAAGDLARNPPASFSGAWGDVNGDGFLDLFVCHTRGRSRLYFGDGRGRFQDVSTEAGLDALTEAYAASFADIDGDGDLDLAVNLERGVFLALNELEKKPGFGSLSLRLRSRRGLIGGIVRVTDARGKPLGMRELNGAESCGGQSSPLVHFALPAGACKVSAILSDGRVAQRVVAVKADGTKLTLREDSFRK